MSLGSSNSYVTKSFTIPKPPTVRNSLVTMSAKNDFLGARINVKGVPNFGLHAYQAQGAARAKIGANAVKRTNTIMMASSGASGSTKYPLKADESVMSQKAHGTSEKPVQENLLFGCDTQTADRICSFNRHYAEHSGYAFQRNISWLHEISNDTEAKPRIYYDSVTGKPLFKAPIGRSVEDFIRESKVHGWPSFRDEEVIWDRVRCLDNGECITIDGTHLGHNLPDGSGNRYCINLVCVAGQPEE